MGRENSAVPFVPPGRGMKAAGDCQEYQDNLACLCINNPGFFGASRRRRLSASRVASTRLNSGRLKNGLRRCSIQFIYVERPGEKGNHGNVGFSYFPHFTRDTTAFSSVVSSFPTRGPINLFHIPTCLSSL